jgi:Fe-S-cluster-containing hydrogenase component 2
LKESWLIDPDKCSGCRICETVCSLQHEGEINPVKSRIRIIKWEEKGFDIPVVCQHCETPVCLENCPTGALYFDEKVGCVAYRKDSCVGCKLCLLVCPAGGIGLDPAGGVLKCDLCGGKPLCVEFCLAKAIEFLPNRTVTEKQRRRIAGAVVKKSVSPEG